MGRVQKKISEDEAHRLLALASAVASAEGKERNAAVTCLNATLETYGYDLVQVFRRGLVYMTEDPNDDGGKFPIFGLGKLQCPVNTRLWKSAAKRMAKDEKLSAHDRAFAAWLATKTVLTADQLSQLYQIEHDAGTARKAEWRAPAGRRKRGAQDAAPHLAQVR